MNNCFFISEGAFTFKVEGTGIITRGFFVSGRSFVLLSSALLAVISLLTFDFSWLVGFLFNFLNFVWSSRIFCGGGRYLISRVI